MTMLPYDRRKLLLLRRKGQRSSSFFGFLRSLSVRRISRVLYNTGMIAALVTQSMIAMIMMIPEIVQETSTRNKKLLL